VAALPFEFVVLPAIAPTPAPVAPPNSKAHPGASNIIAASVAAIPRRKILEVMIRAN
jgi:hypothetical protein